MAIVGQFVAVRATGERGRITDCKFEQSGDNERRYVQVNGTWYIDDGWHPEESQVDFVGYFSHLALNAAERRHAAPDEKGR